MKRIISILLATIMLCSFAIGETATSSLQEMYAEAELFMVQGDYVTAASKFEALSAYSDAAQMTLYCKAIYAANMGMYVAAVDALSGLGQFKDAPQLAQYYTACSFLGYAKTGTMTNLVNPELYVKVLTENVKEELENPFYEMMDEQLIYCFLAKDIFTELALYKDSLMKVAECETRGAEIIEAENAEKEAKYQEALALENEGKYDEALKIYEALNGYKDSYDRILICETKIAEIRAETEKEVKYQEAFALENGGKYEEAIVIYRSLNGYNDSLKRIEACIESIYQQALAFENAKDYRTAIEIYISLDGYKDSYDRIAACKAVLSDTAVLLSVVELYTGDSSENRYVYEYNSDNKLIAKSKSGKFPEKEVYTLDTNGGIIGSNKVVQWGNDPRYTYDAVVEYNVNGDAIKEIRTYNSFDNYLHPNGEIQTWTYEYEYDENHNMLSVNAFQDGVLSEGVSYTYEYEISPDGRILKKTVYKAGKAVTVSVYEYDNADLLAFENVYSDIEMTKLIRTYSYEYN